MNTRFKITSVKRFLGLGALLAAAGVALVMFQNFSTPSGVDVSELSGEIAVKKWQQRRDLVVAAAIARRSCTFAGRTLKSGTSVTAYFASSVPAGKKCESQVRVCNNKVLSGTFTHASCTVTAPTPTPTPRPAAKTCTFAGRFLAHGQSVVAYAAPSVASGSTCVSQTRTCNNGVLSGTFANATCTVQPRPVTPPKVLQPNPVNPAVSPLAPAPAAPATTPKATTAVQAVKSKQ